MNSVVAQWYLLKINTWWLLSYAATYSAEGLNLTATTVSGVGAKDEASSKESTRRNFTCPDVKPTASSSPDGSKARH